MKIISFCNNNSKTGKTTTAFNISLKFSAKGLKTLAIDADPKFDLTNMFGIKDIQSVKDYELLDKNTKIETVAVNDNLDVTAIDTGKRGYGRYKALKNYLLTLKKYDVIIIDTAPTFHEYLPSVVFASDVYVVAKDDWRGVLGIKSVIDMARDLDKKISGIILMKEKVAKPRFGDFEKLLDEYQLKTTIREDTNFNENEKDYNNLAEEIMRKEGLK
jgi:cobyrinic acid ac-diamide synthase